MHLTKNNMKVNEIFQGFQGEGKTVGQNAVFLRLSGCTLKCKWCDTKYHKDGKVMPIEEVAEEILKYNTANLIITGGEPLLWQDDIVELIDMLARERVRYNVTIETNGTVIPKRKLLERVALFSCSPKLANSGNKMEDRIKFDALESLSLAYNSTFKFVVQDKANLDEVKFLEAQIPLRKEDIYLMKEGQTRKSQMEVEKVLDLCVQEGYNFSPRTHIIFFNDKRGV